MRRLAILLFELLIVIAAIGLAHVINGRINIIPRFIVSLPSADYSAHDLMKMTWYFIVIHGLVFLLMSWRRGAWRPSGAKRSVDEFFALIAAYTLSLLAIFITANVPFDPNLILSIGLFSGLLFIVIHLAAAMRRAGGAFGAFGKSLVGRLGSVAGILIILFALTPGILAAAFIKSRDVANVITQIRIAFDDAGQDYDYSLVNAFGDLTFLQPLLVRLPEGDPGRLYVLERHGRLLAVPYPGGTDPVVLLDIRDKVGSVETENGTLGFALHPDYGNPQSENRGYVYVYYTDVRDNKQVNRISRFDLRAGSLAAISASEQPLIILNRNPDGFHNGGSLEFGPDGFLYVALGEGIRMPGLSAYNATLRGGILRIDVDQEGGDISHPIRTGPQNGTTRNYFIPNDNPFIGEPAVLEEYWALGLRNPFRISFDPMNGNLWAGEVGSTVWEEVNLIRKGGHYQFPYFEGREAGGRSRPETEPGTEYGPLYTYQHTAFDRAVIGGIAYRGDRFPALKGRYIFADNYSAKIFSMPADGREVDTVDLIAKGEQFAQRGVTSVVELPDGEILVTELGRSQAATGRVVRLVESGSDEARAEKNRKRADEALISSAETREIFTANCGRCHGPGGKGDGPDVPDLELEGPMPDFTSAAYQESRSDAFLQDVILKGGEEMGLNFMMPPWDGVLSEEEVDLLVKYIRALEEEESGVHGHF